MSLQIRRVDKFADLQTIFRILQEDGAIIFEGFLSPEQVKQMNLDFDQPVIDTGPGSKKVKGMSKFSNSMDTKLPESII
ncbi:hypothetical protein [Acinetobacter lactucae]|uniref:Uncharacterized protein n=1 Tax=Acinetobacter lactucae TaxID=1785128 RepID=R8YUA0_9GAMM|nr:hypothetical protein [Acinetobacter lactucae]EOQ72854.1 hypothetical protein F929_02789 [Acinetobacter lactucae]